MWRMGYLLVVVMMIVLAGLLVAVLGRSRPPRGTLSDKPVVRAEPSAEEATPDASATAAPKQIDQASRRTPPA